MIEAIVSAALLTVGITSILGAYSSLIKARTVTTESEQMQRLAIDKYDELVATEALQTQSLNGDFSDRGDDKYLWSASVTATGTDNLSALTVTVTPREQSTTQAAVNGVVYIPPQTSNPTGGG